MSLLDRITKARAKAEKLKAKSEKAKSKGKDNRSTNLEERSKKKSEKADKLSKKFVKNYKFPTSSFAMGASFGTSKPADVKKSGPKDTSYKTTPAPYHGNTKDTGGKPPKSLNKKNKR